MAISVTQQLAQLNSARQIVLGDAQLYPQIVEGILPIIGASARVELRRWGAVFLAETLASPVVPSQMKEALGIRVLQTIKDLLDLPGEDIEVLKNMVQAAASIYGLVFRYIIANPNDIPVWNLMSAIKSNILKRWDTGAIAVRVCCIKFVQRVVQVQTPGVVDPRRPDKNEISLATVPRDHPQIPPARLEPEASGLLDRLLNVFYEEQSDTILLTATVNCLGSLIRTRPSTFNRILSALLHFNPYRQVQSSSGVKGRIQVKSLEKTIRILLLTIVKRNEDSPVAARIRAYAERLERSRLELSATENATKKRGLPNEPVDGLDSTKRRRLGAELPKQSEPSPLPPGPNSYAQLYTLTDDAALASFGVYQIPQDLVTRAAVAMLTYIDAQSLDTAVNQVRARYLALERETKAARAAAASTDVNDDDEEDYEPDFEPSEDREQILNKEDTFPTEEEIPTELALGPFKLPQPKVKTSEEAEEISKWTVNRMFSLINVFEDGSGRKKKKLGINRLAGSNSDRDFWLTLITRLATRGCTKLASQIREEISSENTSLVLAGGQDSGPERLGNHIRESLYAYVLEDFRSRIDLAISWLNEEWYNDKISARSSTGKVESSNSANTTPTPNYDKWVVKILDGIMPYLDAKDKLLIRFLSEVPVTDNALLLRVQALAKDPERIDLAVRALHYLILMKPPAKEISLDAVENLWRTNDDAKGATAKLLKRYRPEALAPAVKEVEGTQQPLSKDRLSSAVENLPIAGTTSDKAVDDEHLDNSQTIMPVAAAG